MNNPAIFTLIGVVLIIISGIGIVVWFSTQPHESESSDVGDSVDEAVDTIDETEDFMRRVERLSRKEIDKKDDSNRKR